MLDTLSCIILFSYSRRCMLHRLFMVILSAFFFTSEANTMWYRLLSSQCSLYRLSSVNPNARVVLLQIFSIKCLRKNSFKSLQDICITKYASAHTIGSFPIRQPFAVFTILRPYRQHQFPYQFLFIKFFMLNLLIVMPCNPNFICFNILKRS